MRDMQIRRATVGGIPFGTVDDDGVQWGLTQFDGWSGSPASTVQRAQKPRAAGSWRIVPPYLKERTIAAGGVVIAPTAELAATAEDRINAAFSLEESRIDLVEPGRGARWARVERDGDVLIGWVDDRSFKWSAQLAMRDPRKYGDPITLSTKLPASSGGLTWPVTWPASWDATTVSGVLHIDNPGNIPSPITARIDGPVAGAYLRHISSGAELVLSSSYTVGAGSWLDIDMERRQVLENGQASRNGWVVDRGWFALDPGPNDIIFGASVPNPDALLTVTTNPAYQ